MLHNNGSFGPNDPNGQVNMTFNNSVNYANNINKIGQEAQQTVNTGYSLPNYGFGPPHLAMSPQIQRYPNYHLGHMNSQFTHRSQMYEPLPWSSGLPTYALPHAEPEKLPYSYNGYSNSESYTYSQPVDYAANETGTEEAPKTTIDETKRKSLENTVRIIENMLSNTCNKTNNEPDIIKDSSPRKVQEKNPQEEESISQEIPEEEPISQEIPEEEPISQEIPDEEPISQENPGEEPISQEIPEEEPISQEIRETNNIQQSSENTQDSFHSETSRDSQNLEKNDDSLSIEVKVEITCNDSEYVSPFLKDPNGVGKDGFLDMFVTAESSVNEALEAVKAAKCTPSSVITKNYECPNCGLIFSHPKRFLIHTKWHSLGYNNKSEKAKQREKKRNAQREAKMIERMNEVKDESASVPDFSCKDCGSAFITKSRLRYHRHMVHSTLRLKASMSEEGTFKCPECPKQFKHRHSMEKHRASHMEKIHECPDCPKKFGSIPQLKMHSKTHERISRGHTFHCTYCGKGFYESYNLQVHERTHRNERPYVCDICSSTFLTNSSLKRHVKVSHNSSKPYECKQCHKSFAKEKIRDSHEVRVHGDPESFRFHCEQCQNKYTTLKDLQKHTYKAHPKGKRRKRRQEPDE